MTRSKCRQSAVTTHSETTRADTVRLEKASYFLEYSGTYRPRSRRADSDFDVPVRTTPIVFARPRADIPNWERRNTNSGPESRAAFRMTSAAIVRGPISSATSAVRTRSSRGSAGGLRDLSQEFPRPPALRDLLVVRAAAVEAHPERKDGGVDLVPLGIERAVARDTSVDAREQLGPQHLLCLPRHGRRASDCSRGPLRLRVPGGRVGLGFDRLRPLHHRAQRRPRAVFVGHAGGRTSKQWVRERRRVPCRRRPRQRS